MEQEASVKITELEQHVRGNTRRIEGLERGQETLNRLVTAVEVLAARQESIGENVQKLSGKLDFLESRPQRRWESVADRLAVAVLTILIGALFAFVGVTA